MMKLPVGVFLLIIGHVSSTVLIADNTMSKMIELTTRAPFCHVHTDRGKIRDMIFSSDPRKIRQMSDESIGKLVDICLNNGVRSAHQGGFIYPGTKWCGPGTNAKNFTDLGYHTKEDMCCRDHDNCPNNLLRGECRQGICNDSPFTRSHCDCDATFRRCLQNVNTETANTIGAIFFNVVQVICFKERSPCSKQQSDCMAEFVKSGRYVGSPYPRFNWRNKHEFFINILLRKLRLL
ncbi:group 3 secretory phospholipase A2 isoform X1 [Tribolium castaneum]|uniref:group 3 secretory phospholipase A2 isoform X1 n=1 Tax=Tribolium castaneum TaxID=7070 RepID=UPI00046C312B|nr:PREDICTED: group 3 secretory phospholipase A2 isoform X1 [Tribolium castaneum]|eukprot:XP_008201526.1 PREDICTED: group 3 secretory phospholipase A2 isoform X1 [Tribolium castaneum]